MSTDVQKVVTPHLWDRLHNTQMGQYLFRREFAFIKHVFNTFGQPRRILEIGAGSGRLTIPLYRSGQSIVGLDRDSRALEVCHRRVPVELIVSDAHDISIADGSFDCILAIQCLDYLDHQHFFKIVHRLLRPGGLLIFEAQNRHSYKWLLKLALRQTLDLPSANLSPSEIYSALKGAGFKREMVRGYSWLPFVRDSNNKLLMIADTLEHLIGLERLAAVSPKLLVVARRQ